MQNLNYELYSAAFNHSGHKSCHKQSPLPIRELVALRNAVLYASPHDETQSPHLRAIELQHRRFDFCQKAQHWLTALTEHARLNKEAQNLLSFYEQQRILAKINPDDLYSGPLSQDSNPLILR